MGILIETTYTLVLPNGETRRVDEKYLKELHQELSKMFGITLQFPDNVRDGSPPNDSGTPPPWQNPWRGGDEPMLYRNSQEGSC